MASSLVILGFDSSGRPHLCLPKKEALVLLSLLVLSILCSGDPINPLADPVHANYLLLGHLLFSSIAIYAVWRVIRFNLGGPRFNAVWVLLPLSLIPIAMLLVH
jgi:hypothetical protein